MANNNNATGACAGCNFQEDCRKKDPETGQLFLSFCKASDTCFSPCPQYCWMRTHLENM